MAGKSNLKISVTMDDKGASKGLGDLGDKSDDTEKKFGKLKTAAVAGGVALVALGVKSVMAFEDLGLTVGKFADATGATTEEASRLIEVAGDIGISSDTLSSSIGKMSKQLGANKDAFKEYGIEVQKNADGTTNVNETFLASVDAINQIQDPLKKAEAAAKVFGKGYQEMGELLGQSSDEIRSSLAAVSDAKVFDDKKVQDARDMRAAFDSIVDAGQDLLLTIGQSLAPVIAKLAPVLVKVVEAAAPAAEALGEVLVSALEVVGPMLEALLPVIQKVATALTVLADVVGTFKATGLTKEIKEAGASFEELQQKATDAGLSTDDFKAIVEASAGSMAKTGDATKDLATLTETVAGRMDELTSSTHETDRETRRLGDSNKELVEDVAATAVVVDGLTAGLAAADAAYQSLTGKLDEEDAWQQLQESVMTFAANTEATSQDVRDLTRDLADYIDKTTLIPAEKKTLYFAELDEGKLALVEQQLAVLTRNREINIDLIGKGAAGYGGGIKGSKASGGPIGEGGLYQLHKDEIVNLPGGSYVNTAAASKAMMGGLTVQVFAAGHIATIGDINRAVADGIIDMLRRAEIPAGAFT